MIDKINKHKFQFNFFNVNNNIKKIKRGVEK